MTGLDLVINRGVLISVVIFHLKFHIPLAEQSFSLVFGLLGGLVRIWRVLFLRPAALGHVVVEAFLLARVIVIRVQGC